MIRLKSMFYIKWIVVIVVSSIVGNYVSGLVRQNEVSNRKDELIKICLKLNGGDQKDCDQTVSNSKNYNIDEETKKILNLTGAEQDTAIELLFKQKYVVGCSTTLLNDGSYDSTRALNACTCMYDKIINTYGYDRFTQLEHKINKAEQSKDPQITEYLEFMKNTVSSSCLTK